ncbi:hypothetical protein AYI69_g5322, partial [Smittium culicis]
MPDSPYPSYPLYLLAIAASIRISIYLSSLSTKHPSKLEEPLDPLDLLDINSNFHNGFFRGLKINSWSKSSLKKNFKEFSILLLYLSETYPIQIASEKALFDISTTAPNIRLLLSSIDLIHNCPLKHKALSIIASLSADPDFSLKLVLLNTIKPLSLKLASNFDSNSKQIQDFSATILHNIFSK